MSAADDRDPVTPRVVIERGGVPDATELAAVSVALILLGPPSDHGPGGAAWRRAAVHEAAVGVELASPGELRAAERTRRR